MKQIPASDNRGEIIQYRFRVISEGLVTPCTLTDVLEDLL